MSQTAWRVVVFGSLLVLTIVCVAGAAFWFLSSTFRGVETPAATVAVDPSGGQQQSPAAPAQAQSEATQAPTDIPPAAAQAPTFTPAPPTYTPQAAQQFPIGEPGYPSVSNPGQVDCSLFGNGVAYPCDGYLYQGEGFADLAARYYGTVTAWKPIAEANGFDTDTRLNSSGQAPFVGYYYIPAPDGWSAPQPTATPWLIPTSLPSVSTSPWVPSGFQILENAGNEGWENDLPHGVPVAGRADNLAKEASEVGPNHITCYVGGPFSTDGATEHPYAASAIVKWPFNADAGESYVACWITDDAVDDDIQDHQFFAWPGANGKIQFEPLPGTNPTMDQLKAAALEAVNHLKDLMKDPAGRHCQMTGCTKIAQAIFAVTVTDGPWELIYWTNEVGVGQPH